MKKVYKLTLISILSLLVLITTFFVGCSNKPTAENNTPTYPQTFETDTSRDIAQEIMDNSRQGWNVNGIWEDNECIATNIRLYRFPEKNTFELWAEFFIFAKTSNEQRMNLKISIPKIQDYTSTNFAVSGISLTTNHEFSATIPMTDKNFREEHSDFYATRTINFDHCTFYGEEWPTELAMKAGKCITAILQDFDNFFRNELKYFPDKLEDGTVLPTEVAQYAILSYFHLPVAVKINPKIKT